MDSASHWTSRLDYIDLDLEVGPGSGRRYPVKARSLTAGEAQDVMRFPFVSGVLEGKLKDLELALYTSGGRRRRIDSSQEQIVRDFGRDLFDALFTGEVRDLYAQSLREAEHQGKGLRVRLHVEPPELASLPWEFVYDSRQGEYLCLSTRTPLVRYPDLPQPTERLQVTPPLRILGMVVSTTDLAPLDVDYEKQRVEEAVKELRARRMIDLTWLDGQTWRHLQRAMRRGQWHVFHFIGHGGYDSSRDEGLVALANDAGSSHLLRATDLGRLLDDHHPLRLVLLNSCEGARGSERDAFSGTAASLVRRGIPAVLAMQYEISDDAAIEFSRAFYEAVADGMPLDAAVSEARTSVSIAIGGTLEWGTPVLYMRSPDGRIFDISDTPPTPFEPAEQTEPTHVEADLADAEEAAPNPPAPQDTPLGSETAEKNPPSTSTEPVSQLESSIPLTDASQPIPEPQVEADQSRLDRLYADALVAYQAKRWDDAVRRFEEIQALNPNYADVTERLEAARREQRLAQLYADARQRHEARDWPAVLDLFNRIRQVDKDYPDPAGLLTSAYEALTATVTAVRWWQRRRNQVLGGIGTALSVLGIAGGLIELNSDNDATRVAGTTPTTSIVVARSPTGPATAASLPTRSDGVAGAATTPTTARRPPNSNGAMFGANLQHTGVYEAAGPVPDGELLWEVQTGGAINRPPVVAGGLVYFGSADKNAYALDAETKQEIWHITTQGAMNSTPAVAGGTVYFGSGDGNLYAVDVNTREYWTFPTKGDVRSSPAVAGGAVYFGSYDGNFYAVDTSTHKERWHLPTEGEIYSSPAISNGVVYFGSSDGNLYAVDALTGKELWAFPTKGAVRSSPAVVDGTVYFGSYDGSLYAVDVPTHRKKWSFRARGVQSSPAVADGAVYFGSFDKNLYAVDSQTGQEKWRYTTDAPIGASPTIGSRVVYFCAPDRKLHALDMKSGKEKWSYRMHGKSGSAPAIVDGIVYFGDSDGYFYAIK